MIRMRARTVATTLAGMVLLAPVLLVASCGKAGAPTNAEIEQVVRTQMQNANQQTSDRTLGLVDGPYDPASLRVTDADCTARDNGVYRCAVTAASDKGTHTAQLSFKKVDGVWNLVEN